MRGIAESGFRHGCGGRRRQGPSIAVTVVPGCSWSASTTDSWLTITQGASGTGNGTVAFSATANPGPPRTGSLAVAGQTFGVTQPSCAGSLNPASATVAAAGGAGPSIAVTMPPGCAWTASTTDPWLTITQGASGTGNGTVAFSATRKYRHRANGQSADRRTDVRGDAAPCALSINVPHSRCPRPPALDHRHRVRSDWMRLDGDDIGALDHDHRRRVRCTGNGSVTFSVTANTGSGRTGTINIGIKTHTVTQAGSCTHLDCAAVAIGARRGRRCDVRHRDRCRGLQLDGDASQAG